jgi:hypothetical protein
LVVTVQVSPLSERQTWAKLAVTVMDWGGMVTVVGEAVRVEQALLGLQVQPLNA